MAKNKEQDRRNQIFCERCEWELGDDCDYDENGDLICGQCIEDSAERERAKVEGAAAMAEPS